MNNESFEAFLNACEKMNIVRKQNDAKQNELYIQNNDRFENGEIKTQETVIYYVGVFYLDRLGNEEMVEIALNKAFLPEEINYPSIQLFDTYCIIKDTGDELICLDYQDIIRLKTDY
jgi:hypothetical protein